MTEPWTVVAESAVLRRVRSWPRAIQEDFRAVWELLIEEGPESLDLAPPNEVLDWAHIHETVHERWVFNLKGRLYSAFLEIRPDRTIVIREAGAKPLPS